ncbi:hydroxyethylthiazole kinase [Marinococcus luteus]|jgi:hydroxyethylthiazole kinase|uniref:Hydroxyethylthiazole kinase n=1 Tax=Marinococcus luteus TaxID=1122204 RepID=A0A1H2T298_9BACI|nr:hydroxyethylthiazole kinase [Marinococcus luteus]SDW37835.1 hydroxyethylthiazole kinase [Marinococcus luteus]
MKAKEVIGLLEEVRKTRPLIHNITNTVVTNFTANGLLSMGASPVMANAPEEAAEMAKAANALVLNIGTLNREQVKAMRIAGKAANEKGIPVILDPVGAGATAYRTETALALLEELDVALIRANAGEMAALLGESGNVQGVDASGEADNPKLAKEAARRFEVIAAVTGVEDAVAHQGEVFIVQNGHTLLTKVTGTGCLLSSIAASFLTVQHSAGAVAAALAYYGAAAEIAGSLTTREGPGSFQIELLNALHATQEMDLRHYIRVKQES